MAKIHVKRVITMEYEYPFDYAHTNGDSFEQMVEDEKHGETGSMTRYDAFMEHDFDEEVEVTLIEEPTDGLPPAGDITFLCAPTMHWIYNRHLYFAGRRDLTYTEGLILAYHYMTELGNEYGFEVPLKGVREHLLNLRFEDGSGRDKALEDVVSFLNPTEDMGG